MNRNLFRALLLATGIWMLFCVTGYAQSNAVNTKQDLDVSRIKIDSLDNQLMKILGERERIVKAIGIYKAKNRIPSLQAARFQQVVEKGIAAGNKEGLSTEFITELLNAIHKESLRIEGETH